MPGNNPPRTAVRLDRLGGRIRSLDRLLMQIQNALEGTPHAIDVPGSFGQELVDLRMGLDDLGRRMQQAAGHHHGDGG